VVSKDGTVQSFDGPQRLWVFRKRFILLARISASQKEYIRVEERNGTLKNLPGYTISVVKQLLLIATQKQCFATNLALLPIMCTQN